MASGNEYRTIKVPTWACEEAERLKEHLAWKGTAGIDESYRPSGSLRLGDIFVAGLRKLQRDTGCLPKGVRGKRGKR